MESRSTSPSPLFLAPPRWPTSAHLVVVNVTSPTTLLFFSRSLDPLPFPPSSRSASVSLPHRHLCYTGIFIAFGKTGRDFASFLLFLSNLPFPPLPSRFACPISICLSFCFQRSERDRNNLITGRCYVTRKNNCTTIYCDDSFLFFFLICKYNWLVVSIARFETFVRFSLSFSTRSYACIFFSLSKNYRAGCVFEFIFLYIQSSRDTSFIFQG